MAILFALLAALAYGASDFTAGVASRRLDAGRVTAAVFGVGVATAGVGVLLFSGVGPRATPLGFGALSGVGGAVGSLSLYHGMTKGRMTVVVTLSAVLTAVIPVLVGVAMGERLGLLAVVGIIVAVPAIALVSWQQEAAAGEAAAGEAAQGSGALWGLLAGLGFAGIFIAIDHAGTRSGAWPTLAGQAVAFLLVLPFGLARRRDRAEAASRGLIVLVLGTGIVSGAANLLFLAASGHGALAIVAVITAMYPAVTVLLARFALSETTSGLQTLGLVVAVGAVVLVTVG